MTTPINIGNRRKLFVVDYLIERMDAADLYAMRFV
jgi:hypothetical protein